MKRALVAAAAVLLLAACSSAKAPAPAPAVAVIPSASAPKQEAPAPPTPWRVGVYLPFTGAEAQYGIDTKPGIDLAVDAHNLASPPPQRAVQLLVMDDRSNPRDAVDRVLSLIHEQRVVALLGEVASSRSKAGAIVANRLGIPMITPASTNPAVTAVGRFAFRACFPDDAQGRAGARFVVRTLKRTRIALLYSPDDLYSKGLATEFRAEALRLGVQPVAEQTIARGATDFTKELQALKQAKADAIYTPIYYNMMVPIARQARSLAMAGSLFIGADGWDTESFLEDVGGELEGAFMTNHWAPDAPWPTAVTFIAAFKARFGREPNSLAALGYDAALILLDALTRSSSPTPAAIRDAIASTHIDGATGPITFDASRNPTKPVIVVQIRAKKFAYYGSTSAGSEDPG